MERKIIIILMMLMVSLSFYSCGDDDDDNDDDQSDDDDMDDDSGDDDTTDDDVDDDGVDDDTYIGDDDDTFVGDWYIDTVDDYMGYHDELINTSIDLDSEEGPQCVFLTNGRDKNLIYAKLIGQEWILQNLLINDIFPGKMSFALDADDLGHLSIHQRLDDPDHIYENDTVLSYATNDSGVWGTEVIDYGSGSFWGVGRFSSLAVDSNNNMHISYQSGYSDEAESRWLRYITNGNGTWEIQGEEGCSLGSESGMYSSIALDNDGQVHISHPGCDTENYCVRHVTDESGWHGECVPNTQDRSLGTSIAVDDANTIGVAFYRLHQEAKSDFWFSINIAMKANGEWTTTEIEPIATYLGNVVSDRFLALDDASHAHIAYTGLDDEDNPVLKYATNASGEWITEVVDPSPNSGIGASIAVDSDGYVHISYYDNGNSSLKYATNRP